MPYDRDVAAFDARAPEYEHGWLGRLHHGISEQTIEIALALNAAPQRILDVGCGTGYLLRELASRAPTAEQLVGIDPAGGMVHAAKRATSDGRIEFDTGVAERLPFADGAFDLVVTTTSFDHWADQRAGLEECARVLAAGGHFVLADQLSLWLLPTILTVRRGRARTLGRAAVLIEAVGLRVVARHKMYVLVQGISARKPPDARR